jgi:ribonuclease R
VVGFGFFVELERWFVEGLVRAEDLGGRFELDERLHALVDRATGKAWRVGDELEVEVVSASPARRRLELRVVGEAVERRRPKRERERALPERRAAAARGERKAKRGPRPRGSRGRGAKK